jgi:N-acetylmuramoyl-L-alanine amidase
MRIDILNRRKILIFLFFLFILFFALQVSGMMTGDEAKKRNEKLPKEEEITVLSSGADGNIFFEENEFFKKYIIATGSELTKVEYEETEDRLNIEIKSSSELKLNSSVVPEGESRNIFRKYKDGNIISINKIYAENNFVYVDERNKENIIILISKTENPFKYKVVLDPGHGGIDVGAHYGDLYEKNIVLDIVKYMVHELEYNGCEVILTRDDDIYVHFTTDIPRIVNEAKPDVFLSVHVNSFPQTKYHGMSTFYFDNGNGDKDERKRLASVIQKHAVKDDNWLDRGLFTDSLAVLRLSEYTSALIECGFISNAEDRKRLADAEVLKRLAANLANGILEFLHTK